MEANNAAGQSITPYTMASALSKRAAAHPSKILKDDALDYTDDDAAVDYLLDQAKQRGVISVATRQLSTAVFFCDAADFDPQSRMPAISTMRRCLYICSGGKLWTKSAD